MATVFTHAFVASLMAPTGASPVSRRRLVLTLMALALLPDLDVVGFAFGIPYGAPFGHRGLSHSLAFAAVAGAIAAAAVFPGIRRFSPEWWKLCALCSLATASHGLLDALTDGGYGVGFLLPFSNARFFFPWRPLAVSPIGLDAFFSGPALSILMNEVIWIWSPLIVAVALRRLFRPHRSS